MNIHTLKIFCDVIDTCSFSETANLNFITQSAVSQQITSLERKLDDPLFIRGKGKFELTPAGEVLYKYAKEILTLYQSIMNEISMAKNEVSGTIKLSTIYSIGLHELPSIVKRFKKEFPDVHLEINYARMNKVYESVQNGAVDLGIVAFPKKDASAEVLNFRKDHLVLITGPNHRFNNKESIKLSEINGEDFISFDKDIPTAKAINKEFRDRNISVNTIMSFDNIETIKRAVEIETGIAIVPKHTVLTEYKMEQIHVIEFEDFYWERPLGIIVRSGRERQSIVDLFIEYLQKTEI
jgi:DNA-binding transcriptional LysR family regulator